MTSAGGVEENFTKCLDPLTWTISITYSGSKFRKRAINRIGSILIPNSNYCKFEDWLLPILDQMLLEQTEQIIFFLKVTVYFLDGVILLENSMDTVQVDHSVWRENQ